jgi:hypothetical protein
MYISSYFGIQNGRKNALAIVEKTTSKTITTSSQAYYKSFCCMQNDVKRITLARIQGLPAQP